MSGFNPTHNPGSGEAVYLKVLIRLLIGVLTLGALALGVSLVQTGIGAYLGRLVSQLLALQTTQVTWFITRSAGWIAYLLLWLSTAWGLLVPSKLLDGLLARNFTYDFHEFLSLLALAFTGVHIAALLFDKFLPFSITQILLPFLADYRPVWVAVGGLALYLSLLVTATFYLRTRIGMRAFRLIHLSSLVAFFGAALHGLMAGTDSPLPAAQFLYFGTFLSVIFLTVYWLIVARNQNLQRVRAR